MNSWTDRLDQNLLTIGGQSLSGWACLLIAAGSIALVLLLAARAHARHRQAEADRRMDQLLAVQAQMQERVVAMTDVFGARQADLNQSLSQRLDGMSRNIGASLSEQTRATHDNLRRLQERLAVIDTAQSNIQSLARDMAGLQSILANKQTRGAFGQARMETIVADGLPIGAYSFQPTLSNGARPDCTIRMPNGQPVLAIDAKFPLEGWNAIRAAGDAEQARLASQQFRRDLEVHIRDIAGKYLLPGETQDTAFLFVPSESIFADIHEHFEGVVQKAQRARIIIVSPSLLMLSIQLIQAILRDQRMREQAHLIQGEVLRLMEDLTRLDDRVRKLDGHFTLVQKDVDEILTSSDKLKRRGARIEALEVQTGPVAPAADRPADLARGPENRTGRLTLRVVDED